MKQNCAAKGEDFRHSRQFCLFLNDPHLCSSRCSPVNPHLTPSQTRHPPQETLAKPSYRTRPSWLALESSSRRFSCAAAGGSGSAAPSPPAGPPEPPSRRTPPPPAGALPQHVGSPRQGRLPSAGPVKEGTHTGCQRFWNVRTQRILMGLVRSSDPNEVILDQNRRCLIFATAQILISPESC